MGTCFSLYDIKLPTKSKGYTSFVNPTYDPTYCDNEMGHTYVYMDDIRDIFFAEGPAIDRPPDYTP